MGTGPAPIISNGSSGRMESKGRIEGTDIVMEIIYADLFQVSGVYSKSSYFGYKAIRRECVA